MLIETSGLTRHFGSTIAVNNLDFTIERGEVFGFLGHNGAGKTTTVRLLNGILEPTNGSSRVFGLDPMTQGDQIRARVGVLTETPSVDERLTARDNLRVYANLYGVPENEVHHRVDEMLDLFDLLDRADEKVGGYSKGMKQRLALSRAFLHQPELIYLDEPTSGLDPIATRHVHEMIQHFSQDEGHTVVINTHNLHEAQHLCQRVAVMERGSIIAIGTPAELARQTGGGLLYTLEIHPEQLDMAQCALKSTDQATIAETGNDHITVSVLERDAIPHLLAELTAQDIRIYQVIQQDSTLEDVYFTLHKEIGQGQAMKEVQS